MFQTCLPLCLNVRCKATGTNTNTHKQTPSHTHTQAFSVALSGPLLGQIYPAYVWLSLVPIVAGCAMSAMKEVRERGKGDHACSFTWTAYPHYLHLSKLQQCDCFCFFSYPLLKRMHELLMC